MVKWHFKSSPLCLMLSFPTVKDEISSPIPQVQKKSSPLQAEMPFSALEGKQILLLSRLLLRTSCSQPYWLGHSQATQTKLFAMNFITLTRPAGTSPIPT